jgi:hypothetical protein
MTVMSVISIVDGSDALQNGCSSTSTSPQQRFCILRYQNSFCEFDFERFKRHSLFACKFEESGQA